MKIYPAICAALLCPMAILGGAAPAAATADEPVSRAEVPAPVKASIGVWPACLERTFAVGEVVRLEAPIGFAPGVGRLTAIDRDPLAAGSLVRVERGRSARALLVRPVDEARDHVVISMWRGDLAASACGFNTDQGRWWALRLCPTWHVEDQAVGRRLRLSWPLLFIRAGDPRTIGELYRGDLVVVVGPATLEDGGAAVRVWVKASGRRARPRGTDWSMWMRTSFSAP